MRRIILAFPKPETASKISRMLETSGYEVVAVCRSKAELLRAANTYDSALILMSFRMRDGTTNDVYDELAGDVPIAVIIKPEQQTYIEYRELFTISLPINRTILINSIEVLIGRIERRKNHKPRDAADEKLIQKAKLKLMEEHNMSEEQAHRFMQKRSMDMGAKLTDTARMILGL